MSENVDFREMIARFVERDRRYREDAYAFVMATLIKAVESLPKPRHLTGEELLEALRLNARTQYGPMASTVLEHWGVKNSLDFGHIVFNMVEVGILSKTENDKLSDFNRPEYMQTLFDSLSEYQLDGGSKLSTLESPKWQKK